MELSPYTPGAGHQPPVLAGRDDVLKMWRIGLNDVAAAGRRRAQDTILTAPRGAGTTATVAAFRDLATAQGFEAVRLQAAAGNASLVSSLLRRAANRAEDGAGPWRRAKRAFERLGGISAGAAGINAAMTFRHPGTGRVGPTSPEDLAEALVALDREVRRDRPNGGVLITVDELQSATAADLALLAAALGALNDEHSDAHVMFAATGLPNTFQAFQAAQVTHADRLFRFTSISLVLAPEDASYAVVEAARQRQVSWEPEAADLIVEVSSGYPAHLQVLADQTWLVATGPSRITIEDAREGLRAAAGLLETQTMGPRFDALTDREREFLTVLAAHGGHSTSAALAATLGRPRESISQLRETLIVAGDIYVPRRGELTLTAPIFGDYLLVSYESARDPEGPLLSLDAIRDASPSPAPDSVIARVARYQPFDRRGQALEAGDIPDPGADQAVYRRPQTAEGPRDRLSDQDVQRALNYFERVAQPSYAGYRYSLADAKLVLDRVTGVSPELKALVVNEIRNAYGIELSFEDRGDKA